MTAQLKVLVADDQPVHRILLKAMFEAFGCSVTTVEDGAQALAALGPFDLVCLDRHMPLCGGVAVATVMRGRTFLVACTSDPSAGLDDFEMMIIKPISCADISGVIVEASRWRTEHSNRPAAIARQGSRV